MKLLDRISIQAYLKKYLEYYHDVDPFVLTEKNRFGAILISNLRFKSRLEPETTHQLNIQKRYMTAALEIEISESYWYRYGTMINPRGQLRFNNFLLDEFQDRLLEFVSPGLKKKGDLNIMLLTFREKYDICEDELSLKTLNKMWEREKYRLNRCKSA